MDGMEGLLAALHIETHGVHDALNSRHGSGNGAIIIDVGMDRLDAEPNVGEKGVGAFRMPRRDSYRKFALEQMLDDVAAEKASPAEYGHLPSCHRSVPWPMPSCRSAASPVGGNSRRTAGYSLCQTTSLTRLRTHYSHQMTIAARAIAAMKVLRLRSKRVAMRRQSLRRQNMRSMMLRCL